MTMRTSPYFKSDFAILRPTISKRTRTTFIDACCTVARVLLIVRCSGNESGIGYFISETRLSIFRPQVVFPQARLQTPFGGRNTNKNRCESKNEMCKTEIKTVIRVVYRYCIILMVVHINNSVDRTDYLGLLFVLYENYRTTRIDENNKYSLQDYTSRGLRSPFTIRIR